MSKERYEDGEIVQIYLGAIDNKEIKGHEQGKERPCIIVKSLWKMKLLVIVPLTSKKPKTKLYYHVLIGKDKTNLMYDSTALCHHIRTVSTERVTKKIGQVSEPDMEKIRMVLIDLIEQ